MLASFIYIYIPVVIFLLGFTRLYVSLPVLIVLGYVFFKTFRNTGSIINFKTEYCNTGADGNNNDRSLDVDIRFFAAGIILLILVGFFAGWGRWVKQSFDW